MFLIAIVPLVGGRSWNGQMLPASDNPKFWSMFSVSRAAQVAVNSRLWIMVLIQAERLLLCAIARPMTAEVITKTGVLNTLILVNASSEMVMIQPAPAIE